MAGRWQPMHAGVYATFTGAVSPAAWLWAALLASGPGAVAGPRSTLWLTGLLDLPPVFDVDIPARRQVRRREPFRVRRRRDLEAVTQPAGWPPRLRIEEAVLDMADTQARPAGVVDVVLRAVQGRVTTPDRLRTRLTARRTHCWRQLLLDLLADADRGEVTPLEYRWVTHVERRHGLPSGVINRPDHDLRRRYRDVEYLGWGLVCELDGRDGHPDDQRFRDRSRDNLVTVSGRRTLRYGWREIADDACGVAAEVAAVLHSQGWPDAPRRCGPACSLHPQS